MASFGTLEPVWRQDMGRFLKVGTRRRQIVRSTCIGTFVVGLTLSSSSSADTIVERRLAALEPCSGLRQEAFGAALAIDVLESVTLSRAQLDMTDDQVTLSFKGGLSCKTSDTALFPGNASVAVDATVRMSLSDCSISTFTITPTTFGGTYASVVQAAWNPLIQPKIESEARRMLNEACVDFAGNP
ncbi:MAG: hypothetical protein AAF563_03260 [Pseudomonadota bacterium]